MYAADADAALRAPPPVVAVFLTLFLAVSLEFMPWPADVLRFKPIFPLLLLVYWVVHRPRLVNYAAGLVIGVIMDIANQTPLGFNAAGCAVIVFMTNVVGGRFVLLSGFGQAVHVFAILAGGQLTVFLLGLLEASSSLAEIRWRLFTPSMLSAVLWLLLPLLLRYVQRLLSGRRHEYD